MLALPLLGPKVFGLIKVFCEFRTSKQHRILFFHFSSCVCNELCIHIWMNAITNLIQRISQSLDGWIANRFKEPHRFNHFMGERMQIHIDFVAHLIHAIWIVMRMFLLYLWNRPQRCNSRQFHFWPSHLFCFIFYLHPPAPFKCKWVYWFWIWIWINRREVEWKRVLNETMISESISSNLEKWYCLINSLKTIRLQLFHVCEYVLV